MNRLWIKLTLAFLATALVAVGVVALLSARSTGAQFRQYVVQSSMMGQPQVAQSLIDFFEANGSWTDVEPLLADLVARGPQAGMMGRARRGLGGAGISGLTLADVEGRVVFDASGELTGKRLPTSALAQGAPLTLADGRRVGTLLSVQPASVTLDEQGQAFLDRVRWSLVWSGLLAVAVALGLGLLISRRMTAPLRNLTTAAGAVAAGDLTQRVTPQGNDEIGELGTAFNHMAASLQEAETLRRNLMADVAHELRTPLTVIQGNLQAMLDGVYPLEVAQIASAYDESRLLTRLVEDLRDLALAEAGQLRLERTPFDLTALARGTAANFTPAAEAQGIALALDAAPGVPEIRGDADRLGQVLRNLLSNALRHTPSGGRVTLKVGTEGQRIILAVADTGEGIAPEDLTHVFDRFYRGDKTRRGSGAGLGLAIARQIVLAHGGDIAVESALGQGTTFTVRLPADNPTR